MLDADGAGVDVDGDLSAAARFTGKAGVKVGQDVEGEACNEGGGIVEGRLHGVDEIDPGTVDAFRVDPLDGDIAAREGLLNIP